MAYSAEKSLTISDKYTYPLNEKVKLTWGDDAFYQNAGFIETPIEVEEVVLSAIIYDRKNPMAIVNGEAIKLNAMIGKRKVIKIGRKYILLQRGTSIIEVQMNSKKK